MIGARRNTGSDGGRSRWWASFALVFTLSAAWAVSNPLFAGPDEPAHVIKASAVVRGELLGREVRVAPGEHWSYVRVPRAFEQAAQVPSCFVFRPTVPAGCAPGVPTDGMVASVPTEAGRYPPLYYVVVGLPTLLFPSAFGVYLMRLLGAAACAALVAGALESALGARSRAAVLGVAVAVTPMVVFLSGIVNPSSLEIAAALCVWASALAATCGRSGADDRVVARLAVSAGVLLLTRTIAPLWLALIAVIVAAAAGREPLRRLYHHRGARPWSIVVVGSGALGGAWLMVAGSPALTPSLSREGIGAGAGESLSIAIGRIGFNVEQMVGWFGWLDTRSPGWVYAVWAVLLALLVVPAVVSGSRRIAVATVGAAFLAVAVPVVLEASQARHVGAIWQGRYSLPLAVGVPVVAGFVSAQVGAYVQVMRRWVVGLAGPVDYLGEDGWSPPLPAALLLAAAVVTAGALGWWLYHLATGASEPPSTERPPAEAEPALSA